MTDRNVSGNNLDGWVDALCCAEPKGRETSIELVIHGTEDEMGFTAELDHDEKGI